MGGTFNPVHYGHLINAEYIKDEFSLDKILFIPSKIPVHKNLECGISASDRYSMLERALSSNSGFEISGVEVDREEPSYTYLTVEQLRSELPGSELYLIIGLDSYNEFDTWKEYERLSQMVSIIVMRRSGGFMKRENIPGAEGDFLFSSNPIIEISSSCIRERIRANQSVRYMVPEVVIEYINKYGLYLK